VAIWRSTTFSEIVDPASPNEAHAVDQGRAQRVIKVAWDAREQAARDFLGTSEVVNFGGGNYLSRTVPHSYPGYPKLYCTSIPRVEGVGPVGHNGSLDGEHLARYQFALLTLVYTTPPYETLTDNELVANGDVDANGNPSEGVALEQGRPRYVSLVPKPGMRVLTFNRSLLKNANTSMPVLEAVPLNVPHLDLTWTWHQVPKAALPWATWQVGQGRINNATFGVFQAGTLLIEPPEPRPITGPFGDRYFDVVIRARYLPQYDFATPPVAKGWNYVLGPTGTGAAAVWDMIELTVSGAAGAANTRMYRETYLPAFFEPL